MVEVRAQGSGTGFGHVRRVRVCAQGAGVCAGGLAWAETPIVWSFARFVAGGGGSAMRAHANWPKIDK